MLGSIILLAAIVLGGNTDPSASDDLATLVRQLVRDLDSAELAERQAAEEKLLNLGPQALEYLPHDAGPGNAEVAQRLRRIRQRLERARAALGAQASRVTLRGRMTLTDVVTAVQRQTGNKITTRRLDASPETLRRAIDVDFQQTPFWPALDQLLGKAHLGDYLYGEHGSIELASSAGPRPLPGGYVSYAGPFRLQVDRLVAQRDFRPPETRSLKLELEIAWEPRLIPISLKQRLADVQAVDDRGGPLAVDSREATLEIPVPRGPVASRLVLPMALPPREVDKIARLRGTLTALVAGQVETFRFADLGGAQKAERRMAGATVTLEGSTKVGNSLEVRLFVHFDQAGDALASHRTWIFSNPAYLEGRDGKTILPESASPTRQTAGEVAVSFVFPVDRAPAEYTFVYRTPTTIFNTPLEYEFRDIPLP